MYIINIYTICGSPPSLSDPPHKCSQNTLASKKYIPLISCSRVEVCLISGSARSSYQTTVKSTSESLLWGENYYFLRF